MSPSQSSFLQEERYTIDLAQNKLDFHDVEPHFMNGFLVKMNPFKQINKIIDTLIYRKNINTHQNIQFHSVYFLYIDE
jgi:hypothetical protein